MSTAEKEVDWAKTDMKKPEKVLTLKDFIGFGWYQALFVFLMQIIDLVEIVNMSFMVFGGTIPTLSCGSVVDGNLTHSSHTKLGQKEICALVKNGGCQNLTMSSQFRGIAEEWNLVCEDVGTVYLSISIQMAGVLIGAPTFGQISDLYGRKKMYITALTGLCVVGGVSAFSPNPIAFCVFRFLIGFFVGGCITVAYVFRVEFIKPNHRLWISCLGSPIGYAYYSFLAYMTQDWKKLAIIANLVGIPMVGLLLMSRESPRWLISKGRTEEAKNVLRTVAKINRDALDEKKLDLVIEEELTVFKKRKAVHSFWHLFYTSKLAKFSVVLPLAWFSISCISYGILFSMEKLSGSPYLNLMVYGGVRVIVSAVVIITDVTLRNKKFPGRKFYHVTSLSIVGIACFTMFGLSAAEKEKDTRMVFRVLSMLAAAVAGPVWTVVYLLSAELYPTPIRNLANSFCSVFARVGGIVAPQMLYLSHFWSPVGYLAFGSLAVVDLIVFQIFIPETKGFPLPEHMPPPSESLKCCGGEKRRDPGTTLPEGVELMSYGD